MGNYSDEQHNAFTQNQHGGNVVQKTVKAGISFGTCLAIVVSYTAWQSIPWAILHGLMSWVYVVYYFLKYVL